MIVVIHVRKLRTKRGEIERMKMKDMRIAVFIVFLFSFSIIMLRANETPEVQVTSFEIKEGHHFLVGLDKIDPQKALALGYKGYIKISCDGFPEEITVEKGSYVDIPITIEFVNFDSSVTAAEIRIDPKNGDGLFIEQSLGKDMPRIVLNDLVDFDTNGALILGAGQKLVVNARVSIPKDSPSFSIPFGGIGISSDMSTVDTIMVRINVQ